MIRRRQKKNSEKDTQFLFCFWFVPNGFQKYPGLIFIGSSRSPDKFDGQLAYRGSLRGEMRALPPPRLTRAFHKRLCVILK